MSNHIIDINSNADIKDIAASSGGAVTNDVALPFAPASQRQKRTRHFKLSVAR